MCVTGLQCHAVTQTNTPTMPFIELSKTQQWANTHTDCTFKFIHMQPALKSLSSAFNNLPNTTEGLDDRYCSNVLTSAFSVTLFTGLFVC